MENGRDEPELRAVTGSQVRIISCATGASTQSKGIVEYNLQVWIVDEADCSKPRRLRDACFSAPNIGRSPGICAQASPSLLLMMHRSLSPALALVVLDERDVRCSCSYQV